jgi:hypothetical protein
MLKVKDTPEPVFLTYIVWFVVAPGEREPQLKELSGAVQAASEKTLRFAETLTVPEDVRVWLVDIAA